MKKYRKLVVPLTYPVFLLKLPVLFLIDNV